MLGRCSEVKPPYPQGVFTPRGYQALYQGLLSGPCIRTLYQGLVCGGGGHSREGVNAQGGVFTLKDGSSSARNEE